MGVEQLLDEMRTLYIAGHDTTATTLAWSAYLLAEHPEVAATLAATRRRGSSSGWRWRRSSWAA